MSFNAQPPRSSAVAVISFILFAFATLAASAETQVEKAWTILNTGSVNSDLQKRTAAIAVLGLLPKNKQAEELATHALSDPKPEVRAAGATALGDMLDVEALPVLKKALKDADVTVVLASAHSLLALKDKEGYEVYYAILTGTLKSGGGLLADQKKMLNDPKKMAQFGFETGVGFVPFGGLGLAAVKMVTKDDASQVRAASAKILGGDPDPRSGEALVAAASDKSWVVRGAALDAIARRGERSLASRIEPELDDSKDVVQYLAAAAIIRLNHAPVAKDPRR